jgi:hypothetical protein
MIGVVSLRTVLCHITSQCERKSSSRLARYASNALRPSSVRVSKVGLEMLPLSRLVPLLSEFPPFMLDVLDRNRKLLGETIETKLFGLANWMVRFCRF